MINNTPNIKTHLMIFLINEYISKIVSTAAIAIYTGFENNVSISTSILRSI